VSNIRLTTGVQPRGPERSEGLVGCNDQVIPLWLCCLTLIEREQPTRQLRSWRASVGACVRPRSSVRPSSASACVRPSSVRPSMRSLDVMDSEQSVALMRHRLIDAQRRLPCATLALRAVTHRESGSQWTSPKNSLPSHRGCRDRELLPKASSRIAQRRNSLGNT
jgi:hypothetical protein